MLIKKKKKNVKTASVSIIPKSLDTKKKKESKLGFNLRTQEWINKSFEQQLLNNFYEIPLFRKNLAIQIFRQKKNKKSKKRTQKKKKFILHKVFFLAPPPSPLPSLSSLSLPYLLYIRDRTVDIFLKSFITYRSHLISKIEIQWRPIFY